MARGSFLSFVPVVTKIVDDLLPQLVFLDVVGFCARVFGQGVEAEDDGTAHDPAHALRALDFQLHTAPQMYF